MSVKKSKAIIALGSNLGDRLEYLQKAVVLVEQETIRITAFSSLFESPAWGFEGASFYNSCIAVETVLSPFELMQKLAAVELFLGRKRKQNATTYINRTVDLDLLLYEDESFDFPELTLPHPRFHLRNFVLYPLIEIASHWIHPNFNKSIRVLKEECPDNSICKRLPLEWWTPPIFKFFSFIAVEGNIGAGKTTLSNKIAQRFDVPIIEEAFSKNPHLADFYQDSDRFALAVETFFVEDRAKQLQSFTKHHQGPFIADYMFEKSIVFASLTLKEKDFKQFEKKCKALQSQRISPDIVVYLETELEQLKKQIKQRGRLYEQNIDEDYLLSVEQKYKQFFKANPNYPILILPTKGLDFENKESDFQQIIRSIYRFGILKKYPKPQSP